MRIAVLFLIALLVNPVFGQSERQLIDRVVAIVDDESILLSEVLQEMNLLRLQRDLGELDETQQQELFENVLDSMIADQLLVAQAEAKGYEVSDRDLLDAVDEAIRTIKERMGGEERYREELLRQGLTEAEVRDLHQDQKKKQILASRLIQNDLRRQVSVTDDQVRTYFETNQDSLPPELLRVPETLRLAHILIQPHPEPEHVEAARAKIAEAARRIQAGEDFATVAREVSEWPTAQAGGNLGRFRYGDFGSEAFDEALTQLEPGEVSDIVETRFGLQILKLEGREGDELMARHIVVKLAPDEDATIQALEKAQVLRARILGGESFEDLAREHSDDANSRDQGGMLETPWKPSELLPQFRTALDSVLVGETSPVVRGPHGFHVFKVVTRDSSRVASFEETRDKLHRYLEQLEVERRYRDYLEELRQRFYVEIKV